jgi:hypothetical protein
MKIRSLIVSMTFLIVSCGGSSPSSPSLPSAKTCTIELNSDSIMAGVGILRFSSSMFTLRPSYQIVDKAVVGLSLKSLVNGYTTPYAGAPIPAFGKQIEFSNTARLSSVVLIEQGAIDALELADPDVFHQQFESILQVIIAEGRIPVVTGIVPITLVPGGLFNQQVIDRSAQLNSIINELAAKYGVLNAEWRTVPYYGVVDTIDDIHRTQDAANRLILRTLDVLDTACSRV